MLRRSPLPRRKTWLKATNPERQARRRARYRRYLASALWKATRHGALVRAQWTCEQCGTQSMTGLQVHHRTYHRLGHELFNDLLVLCKDCHRGLHGHRGKRVTL